jgi:hypothetical protein
MTREQMIELMARGLQLHDCGEDGVPGYFPIYAELAQAALAALYQAGLAVVPRGATEAMLDAYADVPGAEMWPGGQDVWRAMIAAAEKE